MSVAFDMLDAQQRHHRQILEQSHRAEVAQILARKNHPFADPPLLFKQAGVRDAFHNAFAIFVARAGVAERERPRQIPNRTVGLVNDQARVIRPPAQGRGVVRRDPGLAQGP